MLTNLNRSAWGATEAEYPRLGTAGTSSGSCSATPCSRPRTTTPSRGFQVRRHAVELYANRARSLNITDSEDRQLLISCDCALFHLRAVIWHFGNLDRTHVLPRRVTPICSRA